MNHYPLSDVLRSHLMHERPAHPRTIDELGRQVGVSRSVLHERFVDLAGQPPEVALAIEMGADAVDIGKTIHCTKRLAKASAWRRKWRMGAAPTCRRRANTNLLQI